MPPPLLLSVKDATIRYSEVPVFSNLSFNIHEGSRIALVGKNGAGKSTLMNIITGTRELDEGERWEEIGLTIGYLKQDIKPQANQTVFDFIFTEIKAEERELHSYKVDIVVEALELDPQWQMTALSGGQLRRAGLARALVEEPKILLLDEPTNHLDLEAIEWLETYLKSYRGTLLCISHDRTFLANISNQIFWLDRGTIKICPRGFGDFEEWSTQILDQEARELKNRKQAVMLEVEWASRGVKARRKRNQRRLEQMKIMRDQLRADESAYRRATKKIQLAPLSDSEESSRVVAEFYNVHKSFGEGEQTRKILEKYSLRIKRGDRIGVLGKNGSGKTTFLKLLIGELQPDQGSIKRRKELEFSYFDQKRSTLNLQDSIRKTLAPGGGDYINVMGNQRHVCGYMKDFMFDPMRVQDKVSSLSGGEQNRLMLARILADPKTCLILDEPTNDLDMDTLDMLEETLSLYEGTLIVVSHDRDFLDQCVTQIIAFEGDGKVESCIGGYSDYMAFKKNQQSHASRNKVLEDSPVSKKYETPLPEPERAKPLEKLTYKLEYELKELPGKISALEDDIAGFNTLLADSDYYQKDPQGFHDALKKLQDAKSKLERYETRWLELEEMQARVKT